MTQSEPRTRRLRPPAIALGLARRHADGRRALVAAGLGWMLDAFDVMLFALVLTAVRDARPCRAEPRGLASLTLLASAAGGSPSASSPIASDGRGR